jgi:hypothetical protein
MTYFVYENWQAGTHKAVGRAESKMYDYSITVHFGGRALFFYAVEGFNYAN